MKRFKLCASVTAIVIGMAVANNVRAADKGSGRNNVGSASAMQSGPKSSGLPVSRQVGGTASNLKKQGNTIPQNQSSTVSKSTGKKIDSAQLTNKNNGPQGNKQQLAKNSSHDSKSKDQHFDRIKERCYFGKENHFWSEHCWNDRFGCDTYFCSTRRCWYFWYEPFTCYVPCEYWSTYCEPVIEVSSPAVEVAQPVVEVAAPVVELQPVRYVVRPYVVYSAPSYAFGHPGFTYYVRH